MYSGYSSPRYRSSSGSRYGSAVASGSSSYNGYRTNGYDHVTSSSYMASKTFNSRPPVSPGYTSPFLSDTSIRYPTSRRTGSVSSLPPAHPSPNLSKTTDYRSNRLCKRSVSLSPSRIDEFKLRESLSPVRQLIRDSFNDDGVGNSSLIIGSGRGLSGSAGEIGLRSRLKSPSVPRERTRDELIDSIVHTRTREHRVMPGFVATSDWSERRAIKIDCDKVYPGIILGNGDTIKNVDYLKGIRVTHVLNTAERHVPVNPDKYPLHGINYYGFHVDDHPSANISRYFARTTEFIDEAVKNKGLIVVNCVMGWSRSATIVAAYLMMRKGMSSSEALETIRQSRPIRPNPGFLQQLADHENLLNKKLVWS